MIKKVHLRLTLFSLLITSTILIGLSLICLYISEQNIRSSSEQIFQNQLYGVISYLEAQQNISLDWLSATENNKRTILSIADSAIPDLHSAIRHTAAEQKIITLARKTAAQEHHFSLSPKVRPTVTRHTEFQLESSSGRYLVSAMLIPKPQGFLAVTMLSSLRDRDRQIFRQRILFLVLDLAGLLLLALFSWNFTGKILAPVILSKKRQNEFIAAASHELRTPLMVILSNLNAMDTNDPQHFRRFKHAIRSESLRMSHLVDDMLTLARSDNQRTQLEIAPAALDTLIITSYEKYQSIAAESDITLTFRLPEELMAEYPCDGGKIEQVLGILLDNAISYTPPGGRIEIAITVHSENIRITVTDTGPGIPDEDKEAVFERFVRRGRNQTAKDHFGLGLSIAKEYITQHSGDLSVTDNHGGGAVFTITLPPP